LDLQRLEYFITIVDAGNISAAAKVLHMSQPPLSNHMKLLEKELDLILFERGARHIKLTEAGKILYNKATILLELSKSTLQELDSYKKGITGTLKIGIASSIGNIFLKKWVLSFHRDNPDIRYEIIEANTYQLLEQLKTNNLDLAVVRTPFPLSSFKSMNLLEESMVAVGSKKYFTPYENSDTISLEELCKMPILLYRRWEDILVSRLKEKNLEWEIFCKNDDARTTLMWANEGLGVGIVPESAADFADAGNTIIKKISDLSLHTSIAVVYNTNTYQSLAREQFLKCLTS
jgi:LysR family transcriptional regulator, salicylic acid-responsive activator of bsdBCD